MKQFILLCICAIWILSGCEKEDDRAPKTEVSFGILQLTPKRNYMQVLAHIAISVEYHHFRTTMVWYRKATDDQWTEMKADIVKEEGLQYDAKAILTNLSPKTKYIVKVCCILDNVLYLSNPEEFTTGERFYSFGDVYPYEGKPQGVVFQVRDEGLHGSIVSLDEGREVWSTEEVTTGANDSGSGEKNMAIIKALNPSLSKYPAFKWCADKGDGWYLPALYEVFYDQYSGRDINETLKKIEGAETIAHVNDYYWTSTELNYPYAWSNGVLGSMVTPGKEQKRHIRACKNF